MPLTRNPGAAIHWTEQGKADGPAVVLLHSIGTDLTIYRDVEPLLAGQCRVIAIDIRGHGRSEASDGEYSMALLASDVLAVMDDAGIEQALVCGTSLGGMIAMELVQRAPQRVSGLILANTSPGMSPVLWRERVQTAREQGVASILVGWAGRHLSEGWMAEHPARVEELEQRFAEMDPLGYVGNAAAIRDMDLLPGLAGVTVPTLIIAGELDIATPFEGHGSQIAQAIPAARVAFLPTGHLACMEQPEQFAHCVLDMAGLRG